MEYTHILRIYCDDNTYLKGFELKKTWPVLLQESDLPNYKFVLIHTSLGMLSFIIVSVHPFVTLDEQEGFFIVTLRADGNASKNFIDEWKETH